MFSFAFLRDRFYVSLRFTVRPSIHPFSQPLIQLRVAGGLERVECIFLSLKLFYKDSLNFIKLELFMFDIGCKLLFFCIFTLLNLLAYYSFITVKPTAACFYMFVHIKVTLQKHHSISLLVVRNFTRMNVCIYNITNIIL